MAVPEQKRLAADVCYFDAMAQIHLDRWSAGRVALVGAYVLAQELGRAEHETAFAVYERRMRPFVALNQALATENPTEHAKNAISLEEAH